MPGSKTKKKWEACNLLGPKRNTTDKEIQQNRPDIALPDNAKK
jgi:hypothetical protein